MKIPIKVSRDKFYKVLLTLMNKFPPLRGMREREIDFLAEIMYQNYLYRNLDISKRYILIFSTENRKEMQKRLVTNEGVMNDNFSKLRKRGIITQDNKLIPFLNIIPDSNYELTITFNINE